MDVGYQAGLQRGDTGLVYFEVAAGSDLIAVQVGTGIVVEAAEQSAAVEVDRSAVVEPGHLVRFEIPEGRLVRPPNPAQAAGRPGGRQSEFFVAADVEPCLNVRPFPATFSQPLDCLPPGTSVEVTDRMPGWKRTRLIDGTVGWVAEAYLSSSPVSPRPAPRRPAPRELPDLDLMRQRLESAKTALDASESARRELERQLEQVEERAAALTEADRVTSGTAFQLRAQLEASSATLNQIRSYRLKLQRALSAADEARDTVIRRILNRTVSRLQRQLRRTATDLRQTAEERNELQGRLASASQDLDRLRQRVSESEISRAELLSQRDRLFEEQEELRAAASESMDKQVIAELAATLEDLEARRREAERRAIVAEGKNAELEIRLERAEDLIAEFNGRPDDASREPEIERAPSIEEPLDSSEFVSPRETGTTPASSEPEATLPVTPSSDASSAEEQALDMPSTEGDGQRVEEPAAESPEGDSGPVEEPPAPAQELGFEDDDQPTGARPTETPSPKTDNAPMDDPDGTEGSDPSEVATRIETITWREENGSLVLLVTLDGAVSREDCEVMKVRLGTPRDVLKIRGLEQGLSPSTLEVGVGPLERLRTGRHWNGERSEVHLITELSRPDAGIQTIQIQENTLTVTIF